MDIEMSSGNHPLKGWIISAVSNEKKRTFCSFGENIELKNGQ